ncbi:MAG: cytochrome c3 family protein [Anaerolineaceae bacterium]|nr:cytochrome c3 family protein [Anaerolineaceae bacterium]
MEKKPKRWILFLAIGLALALAVIVLILITTKPMPVALIKEFSIGTLWEEGVNMNKCAKCHDGAEFHSCTTCHDDHGAVELAGIQFYAVIDLTGDVPDPSFIRINEVMPNQENAGTHITVQDFLAQNGVEEYESVTLITNDGGQTTIASEYIDETAMLVPYVDGVRFASETLHASSWLKGITRIVVVGTDTPLTIDGHKTSIGRLLTGETVRVPVESTDVMLADDEGNLSHATTANWIEGALLASLLETSNPPSITVTDSTGETIELSAEEIEGAVVAMDHDSITLVLPARGRSAWLVDITSIESN